MEGELQKVAQAVGKVPVGLIVCALLGLAEIVVVVVVVRVLRSRRAPPPEAPPDLTIDVASLPTVRAPVSGPRLHFLHVPVRLAVVVLAPAGRVREVPADQVSDVLDSIVPGLSQVVSTHSPMIRRWPGQMSIRGFANTFSMHAKLPGQGGRGTPWCSAAGVFKVAGQPMMAGLVMCADAPTNIGPMVVERETQWLDLLRIQ